MKSCKNDSFVVQMLFRFPEGMVVILNDGKIYRILFVSWLDSDWKPEIELIASRKKWLGIFEDLTIRGCLRESVTWR